MAPNSFRALLLAVALAGTDRSFAAAPGVTMAPATPAVQAANRTAGLLPQDNGEIIFDSNQNVYWLADANLAADPKVRAAMNVAGINADGTMDYPTAVKWVAALNHYAQPGCPQGKTGYLCHDNWQLPVTPNVDATCSSIGPKPYRNYFGVGCIQSALGSLYSKSLDRTYPESVDPNFKTMIGPIQGLKPSLYWTRNTNPGGKATFSFVTGIEAGNTPKYNYFYVLAMQPGWIGNQKPPGTGLVPYPSGPAAGKAIYDSAANITWATDAHLAESADFGVSGTVSITSVNGKTVIVPLINTGGAMLFDTASQKWLPAMRAKAYAGSSNWQLPQVADLVGLFGALKLQPGDARFLNNATLSGFRNLQPFFYWSCERDDAGNSNSPCNGMPAGKNPQGATMQWSFNLDTGFEGTTKEDKPFHVVVYYAPISSSRPAPSPTCTSPQSCCVLNGGHWTGSHCE